MVFFKVWIEVGVDNEYILLIVRKIVCLERLEPFSSSERSVKGESGSLSDMSIKGESGESKEESTVSRAKESLVSKVNDTLHALSHIPNFPTAGGALRNLKLMI